MLILDTNILIRAGLGSRVPGLLRKYAKQAEFLAPEAAFQEEREHLPVILERQGVPVAQACAALEFLGCLVETIARQRLARRDEDDWPVLATALASSCPIWTEDTDVFGCGVATWTTDRVELYLPEIAP